MAEFLLPSHLPEGILPACVECIVVFQEELQAGRRPDLRVFLDRVGDLERRELFSRLLTVEISHRRSQSETISAEEYLSRFPEWSTEIADFFSRFNPIGQQAVESRIGDDTTLSPNPPHAGHSAVDSREKTVRCPPSQPEPVAFPPSAGGFVAGSTGQALPGVGKYPIERLLGEGGFGRVYLCRHPELDDLVAVKVLRKDRTHPLHDPLRLIREEGQKLRQMSRNGARVVPVHDIGTTAEGEPFLVMDFIPGGSLRRLLGQRGALPWREAAMLVADLAHTLAEVHSQDLYHRDIKPDNILLDNCGLPYLTDFGLASRFENLAVDRSGYSAGYASPEQIHKIVHLDGRSDIFSLGVVLYELLTGRRPIPFRTREEYKAKLADPFLVIPPVRQKVAEIPAELDELCQRCLQLNPVLRPTTAADIESQLRTLLVPAPPPPKTPQQRWFSGSLAALGLALLIPTLSMTGMQLFRAAPGQSQVPGNWGDVSGGIEQVIWPGHDGETTFSLDPQGKTLSLLTSTTCVVSLGTPQPADFLLKVTVRSPSEGGMAGLCWNIRREDYLGQNCLVMQALVVEGLPQFQLQMRMVEAVINPETGQLIAWQNLSGRRCMNAPISAKVDLAVRVQKGRIVVVNSPNFCETAQTLTPNKPLLEIKDLGLITGGEPAIFSDFSFEALSGLD